MLRICLHDSGWYVGRVGFCVCCCVFVGLIWIGGFDSAGVVIMIVFPR